MFYHRIKHVTVVRRNLIYIGLYILLLLLLLLLITPKLMIIN